MTDLYNEKSFQRDKVWILYNILLIVLSLLILVAGYFGNNTLGFTVLFSQRVDQRTFKKNLFGAQLRIKGEIVSKQDCQTHSFYFLKQLFGQWAYTKEDIH